MKKTYNILSKSFSRQRFAYCLLLATYSLLASCDTITESDRYIDIPLTVVTKRVLLEEYTGMRCLNCPAAGRMAAALKMQYGENLILVSVHTGNNAKPVGSTFREDFRSEAGNAYAANVADFGGDLDDHPKAMIDRTVAYEGKKGLPRDRWAGAVMQQLKKTTPVEIGLSTTWDEVSKTVTLTTNIDAIEDYSEQLALQLWIVEDSIVAPQLDGSDIIENYVHRHVLRAAINGIWGENLEKIQKGTTFAKSTSYLIPEKFSTGQIQPTNYDHCYIVAFVYRVSDKSIVQVNETKVN
jgi:hypothetical protein